MRLLPPSSRVTTGAQPGPSTPPICSLIIPSVWQNSIHRFLRHGLSSFQCSDVLRFLGKNRPEVFSGELTGTLKHRPERLRLKHTVNGISLKMYDKEGQALRV